MPVFCQRGLPRVLAGLGMIACLFAFVSLSLAHSAVSPSFSLEPALSDAPSTASKGYFVYSSAPGARIDDSIHVTNEGLSRGSINLYAVDVTTGQVGGTAVLSYTDPRRDVGAWITLSQQQVTLDPGQSQDIPFTVLIPEHVRPGQHGGAIIAENTQQQPSVQSPHSQSSMKLNIQSVVALGVLINLPGPLVERLDATRVRYDEKSTHQRLLLTLENTGTQLLHPSGSLQLRDDEGQLLQTVPMVLNTFIPQTSIDYPIDIEHKALVLGASYSVQLSLKYEHNHNLKYASTFLVPLPEEGPIADQVQALIATPSANFFSTLTLWHYALGLSLLFLIVSALFFWSKQFHTIIIKITSARQQQPGKRLKPPTKQRLKPATEDVRVPVHARSRGKDMKD